MDFNFTLEGLAMSNCWVILFEKFFAREAFLMRSHMKGLKTFESKIEQATARSDTTSPK